MLAADLVDEINVTISANMVGGNGPRLTAGATDVLQRFQLAHVCEDDGFLFLALHALTTTRERWMLLQQRKFAFEV
jgi:riboflavin biosynthesis pyrimidine reductase